jgi:acetolactate synthase small subunit
VPSTIATVRPADAARPEPRETRMLALEVREADDVLNRVLTVLQRRHCRVTSLDFRTRDRHQPGRFLIGVQAPAAHADRVSLWLEGLTDVLAVERVRS